MGKFYFAFAWDIIVNLHVFLKIKFASGQTQE